MAVLTCWPRPFLLLSLLPLIVVPRPHKQNLAMFHSTRILSDVIFQRALLQESRTSRVGCASKCHIHTACRSYFYKKSSHTCRTHSDIFSPDDTDATPNEGWEYYGKRKGRPRQKKPQEQRTAITTVAPGMGGGIQFALNATTTPAPATDDDEDGEEEESETESIETSTTRPPTKTREATLGTESSISTTEKQHHTFSTRWVSSHTSTPIAPSRVSGTTTHGSTTSTEGPGVLETTTAYADTELEEEKADKPTGTTDESHTTVPLEQSSDSIHDSENTNDSQQHDAESEKRSTTEQTDEETVQYGAKGEKGDSGLKSTTTGESTKDPHSSLPPHDESMHDAIDLFGLTQDVGAMSTDMTLPGVTVTQGEDGEGGSVTFVIVMDGNGDDDDDEDDGEEEEDGDEADTIVIDTLETDTTVNVMTLGSHTHEDDNDGFWDSIPLSTALFGLTMEPESAHNGGGGAKKYRGPSDAPGLAKRKEAKQVDDSQTTEMTTTYDTSSQATLAMVVLVCVVVPLVGVLVYAVYRKRRTGSWSLIHRRDDGLGLQLIRTME